MTGPASALLVCSPLRLEARAVRRGLPGPDGATVRVTGYGAARSRRQAQALAYQDVYLLSALVTLPTLVLAFFLTLVLGLGESVSIQSMSVTIQALRAFRPTLAWFVKAMRREIGTACFLGASCGILVALIVWGWRGAPLAAGVIGGSIFLTVCAACFFGLAIPSLLHWLKLDPRIAAGPITLALTDIATLLFYFNLAVVTL